MSTTKELLEEYSRTGNQEIRNQIVENNLYMVDSIVKKYLNKGIEYDDLYQIAAMGLVMAVDRFDPSKGYEFSTFAAPTIIGEIKRYFRDKGWAMHIPRSVKNLSIKIPAAKEELTRNLSRNPTIKELADFLGATEEQVLIAMESSNAYSLYSLDKPIEGNNDEGGSETYEKYTGVDDKAFDSVENSDLIQRVMDNLSEIEKKIFKMRFIDGITQSKVAAELGVSQMSVSRMEKKLRAKFKEEYNK